MRAGAVVTMVVVSVASGSFGSAVQVAPSPDAQIAILSPGADAYVSGPTLLRARIEPPEAAASLTFFVDGRQVCTVPSAPWECDWDAGPTIACPEAGEALKYALVGLVCAALIPRRPTTPAG